MFKLLFIFFTLQSCTPALIGIATSTAVVTSNKMQEKSLGTAIDDTIIWAKITSSLIQNNHFSNIKVRVDEGRVLLTGIARDAQSSLEAVKIAWNYIGVKEVINEILVQEEDESVAKSSMITAQIKAKLLVARSVKSLNYTVVTIDDVVYLFGVAQNNNELNRVITIASTVDGVEKVISHVRLKTSKLRKL